jgi:hypothetical protein
MTEVAILVSSSFVDPLGTQRELFALRTAAKAQPRALLFYPGVRAWARKGYFLFARAIADSLVKKKNGI